MSNLAAQGDSIGSNLIGYARGIWVCRRIYVGQTTRCGASINEVLDRCLGLTVRPYALLSLIAPVSRMGDISMRGNGLLWLVAKAGAEILCLGTGRGGGGEFDLASNIRKPALKEIWMISNDKR